MTIDCVLMKMADNHNHVIGTYYGAPFSGVAFSSRQNTVNYREELWIKIDKPLTVLGYTKPIGDDIIITGWNIDNGDHTVRIG